nr:hypothetical protein [Tanacetum cinerariifolium]
MTDPAWIESMQGELLQFKRMDVWVLVPAPDNILTLTLKWIFKNKHDEEQTVIRNKSRLVVRGYRQEEGLDFEESFAPVKKALYRLKQAPKAWYDELSTFLLQNNFFKGTIDQTLFIRRFHDDILVTSTASTTTADNVPIPTNSSSHAINISIPSQEVDELNPNAMLNANTFVNPFANSSTSAAVASSSSQNVDPSNMHTFYQPYPHEFQWTKDHPLEQVLGEPSRPVLTRNRLRYDGDMCIYALTVSTMEPKNVKEAM